MYICPVCKKILKENENNYLCKNGHSFDKAAEGYVHLLPVSKMHSKIPGDNKLMVNARRSFFATGGYDIFKDEISRLVCNQTQSEKQPVIVDAGCGEGYYTGQVQALLAQQQKSSRILAFDISKFAVKAAAKRYKGINFSVASIFDIPITDHCADCVMCVFAPIVEKEFYRVLKPGGTLILAVPGPRHLWQLKQVLYENPYLNQQQDIQYEGFILEQRVPVKGEITLNNNEMIQNLFSMTPYYYKTPRDGAEKLAQLSTLTTEIHFDLLVYRAV
ncbi:MAG: methyltransferase domain-containing protein [Oscillospiraceae bacterium]|nr:methyltransferase domain-containing protein [Oscillospiraceae bacterium]